MDQAYMAKQKAKLQTCKKKFYLYIRLKILYKAV